MPIRGGINIRRRPLRSPQPFGLGLASLGIIFMRYANYVIILTISIYFLQVKWYKSNILLAETNTLRIESRSNRHTLVLSSIRSGHDFGNYSCVAENSLGTFR